MPQNPLPLSGIIVPAPMRFDPMRFADRLNGLNIWDAIYWFGWFGRMEFFDCHDGPPYVVTSNVEFTSELQRVR